MMTTDEDAARSASAAYANWVADGRPWKYSRPLQMVAARLRAHGYVVYLDGDERHLTKATPEDHTPFSATGWPVKSPYPYCNALDVMPPKPGQVSNLTGRRLPSLQELTAQLRADRLAEHPATLWLKYINWEPEGDNVGPCYQDSWRPGYARRTSTDRGHTHASGRSDMVDSTAADNYDLVARTEANMTIFGWDASHYDATPNGARVVAEGFSFMTHKAGGDTDAGDVELASWWSAMKPYRDRLLLGAYWVLYPGRPLDRADAFIARLNSQCPGWRDTPFILQVDCEIWRGDSSTKPGKADIKAFCDRLTEHAPKLRPIVYAPKWAYGDSLSGLGYPLWASSYVTGSGAASALYPGDNSSRWGGYSGQVPAVLQFTSSATIAGQTTCDANAFRGTLNQLTALMAPGWIEEDMATPLTNADADLVIDRLLARTVQNPYAGAPRTLEDQWRYIPSQATVVAGVGPKLDALSTSLVAAINALAAKDFVDEAALGTALAAGVAALLPASPENWTVDQLAEAFERVLAEHFAAAPAAARLAAEDRPDDEADRLAREAVQPRVAGSGA